MVQRHRCHGGIVVTWLQLLRISKLRMAGLLRVHWLSWQLKITVLCDGKMLPKVVQRYFGHKKRTPISRKSLI
jgi:hypothetical protein